MTTPTTTATAAVAATAAATTQPPLLLSREFLTSKLKAVNEINLSSHLYQDRH